MVIGNITEKIRNRVDSHELYEVPSLLCLDNIALAELPAVARQTDVVNQLGVMVEMTLTYLIPRSHERYASLCTLKNQLESMKSPGTRAFYSDENPQITRVKEQRMGKMNEPRMYEILKAWGVIAVLSPDKFKQVYKQDYADRQEASKRHSFIY